MIIVTMFGFYFKYNNSYLCHINISNFFVRFLLGLPSPQENKVVCVFKGRKSLLLFKAIGAAVLLLNDHV